MAKKQTVDPQYMDWAEGVDPAIVEKFLQSSAAERIVNLHGGMTKAQQRAAELEKQQSRVRELEEWATKYEDLYRKLPQWADLMRSREVADVQNALTRAKSTVEEEAADVVAALEAGTLEYEKALPIVLNLRRRYDTINEQVEDFRRFRETEVPKLVDDVRKGFGAFQNQMLTNNQSLLELVSDVIDYTRSHPERSAKKIFSTFVEGTKENKQYRTFQDVANDAYGEDDTEARVEQQVQERIEAKQREQATAHEAPIGAGLSLGPWRRGQQQQQPRTPPTTQAEMRSALMERFQKTE